MTGGPLLTYSAPSGVTQILVVTGVSGAGKSTVLRALEDNGYYCIDNLPTVIAPEATEQASVWLQRNLPYDRGRRQRLGL